MEIPGIEIALRFLPKMERASVAYNTPPKGQLHPKSREIGHEESGNARKLSGQIAFFEVRRERVEYCHLLNFAINKIDSLSMVDIILSKE